MSLSSFSRRIVITVLAAAVAATTFSTPARAQDVISKESAASIKASFIVDIDNLHTKFLGLAQAFPQDKYTWRPMDGVRSVSEVLMLAAMEGYAFIPNSFGGKPFAMGTRDEVAAMRTLSDKAKVIEHLNKGFAHAKADLMAIDPATLTGKRKVMGADASVADAVIGIGGDLHEHLGQMIAYARMNHIVPPWSK